MDFSCLDLCFDDGKNRVNLLWCLWLMEVWCDDVVLDNVLILYF